MIKLIYLFFILCAVSATVLIKPRILGGVDVADGEYPFHVSIQYLINGSWQHYCSGVILSSTWVAFPMTCKHIGGLRAEELPKIVVGHSDICNVSGASYDSVEIVPHPEFTLSWGLWGQQISKNDIGLIKLSQPLTFNEAVQPAILPTANVTPSGNATVIGWGGKGSEMYCRAQKVDQEVITNDLCLAMLMQTLGIPEGLNAGKFCALPETTTSHSCYWDNGSPLVQDGVVIGIGSFLARSCFSLRTPSVYAQLSYYMDFISEHVADRV